MQFKRVFVRPKAQIAKFCDYNFVHSVHNLLECGICVGGSERFSVVDVKMQIDICEVISFPFDDGCSCFRQKYAVVFVHAPVAHGINVVVQMFGNCYPAWIVVFKVGCGVGLAATKSVYAGLFGMCFVNLGKQSSPPSVIFELFFAIRIVAIVWIVQKRDFRNAGVVELCAFVNLRDYDFDLLCAYRVVKIANAVRGG